tara:strand:- start:63 stop:476 length:414 start_codon:yes stop_codon:yes gene_type:complete
MKTTKFTTALFFVAILFSGYVSGQQFIQADKYQLDETNETEIIIDDLTNPHYTNVEPFKALIFPNPSLTGKVKMTWLDNQNVDQVILLRNDWDGMIEISIKDEKEIIIDSLENGIYFVKFFYNQKLLATQKLKIIKE